MKRKHILTFMILLMSVCLLFCSCQGEQGIKGEQGIQGEQGVNGKTPEFRENNGWLEWKYEDEDDTAWRQIYQLDKPVSTEFTYVLNADGESYSIAGISNFTSTTVEIPAEYNGKPITKISSVSPLNYSGVKEVVIPNSVTEIGKQAFMNCSSLEKVNIPESVKTIGMEAFHLCSSLKEISLNVETIEPYTFDNCKSLEKVTLGDRTKEICDRAFVSCSKLAQVNFNDGLVTIGSAAFLDCESLSGKVVIPASVTMIKSSAFTGTKIAAFEFEDTKHWIYHSFDDPMELNHKCVKFDATNEANNAELLAGSVGGAFKFQKGILVGVSGDIPPFAEVTVNSQFGFPYYSYSGFDIDLIKGIDAKIEDYIFGFTFIENFDESFAGIDNGKYDIVISAMEYTAVRAENYSVSDVYYTDGESNLVIYGDKDDPVLMTQINEALEEFMSSPEYSALKTKYHLQ